MTAKIKLNAASGGGSFSLQAPSSSANNRVFTLPDSADATILTSTTATGKILQVVSNSSNTNVTTSGSTISDILNVSITPASASNKILLMATCCLFVSPSSNAYSGVRIYKGTSSSGTLLIKQVGGQTDGVNTYTQAGISFVDSPNTTSATTYTLSILRESGNTTSVSTDNLTYTIIAQEIAA